MLLALLHPAHVIGQRDVRLVRGRRGGGEAQQLGDLVLVPEVLGQALLEDGAELLPERGVLLRLLLGDVGEQPQHLLGRVGPDVVDHAAALQQLAGDVQRQVGGVDHAADEPEVLRHQLAGVLQHEDPPDVQLDAPPGLRDPQVEGRPGRDEQQQRVLVGALDLAVHPDQRVGEVAGDMLVEVLVVLLGELALGPRPQRRGLVDLLLFFLEPRLVLVLVHIIFQSLLLHEDRNGDVIGVLAQDRAQPESGEKLILAFAQVQDDFGAATLASHRLQRVLALAVALPAHAVLGGHSGAPRDERHLVRDDERRIEADAELADEVRVFRLVAGQALEELAGAGLGDGADVADHLVARHADTIVRHAQRARGLVVGDTDLQVRIALPQSRVDECLEAQLIARIRRVRNELTQKDFLVTVQRVHHQVQELLDLGLKTEGLRGSYFAHGRLP